MPSLNEHRFKADRNREVLAHLEIANPPNFDWIVTLQFYIALHEVESYLATKYRHSGTHKQRNDYFYNFRELHPIEPDFISLEDLSRDARYKATTMLPADARAGASLLLAIESHIAILLSTTAA